MSGYEYEFFNISSPHEFVAVVEINRPQKLNAFHDVMWKNLGAIFKRLSHDPDVRCVVLTAAGEKAFSAGLDVQEASTGGLLGQEGKDPSRVANDIRRHIFEFQDAVSAIEKCEKPVIACLHGISYGLAIDITTCCDIRLCTKDVRLAVKEVDIGLAADIGTLSRLPHSNLPLSFIKDVALTARDFSSAEALAVGFVSGVYASKGELLAAAMEKAVCIAAKSPVAVLGTKEVLNYSRDHGVQEGLRYVAVWNAAFVQSADVKSALTAGLERRKAVFAKL